MDTIKFKIHKLEQEKMSLEYSSGSMKPEETNRHIKRIEDELQQLYEQLGGVYVSEFNLNYKKRSRPDEL